jgi:hypothetical protein
MVSLYKLVAVARQRPVPLLCCCDRRRRQERPVPGRQKAWKTSIQV